MAHTDIGANILKRYAEACEEIAVMDKNPKLEGRHMSMFLSPRVQKPEKAKKEQAEAPTAAPEPKPEPEQTAEAAPSAE
jgi:hypothetical protein